MRPPSIPASIPINADDSKQTIIMKTLYNALIEHREPKTNRILIQHFMYLPSRKDFPEYFNIIEKPLSVNKVKERIEKQYYKTIDDCLADFRLIFNNCRLFNEDESQIYQDSVELESILDRRKDKLLHSDSDSKNNHLVHHHQNLNSQTTTTTTTNTTNSTTNTSNTTTKQQNSTLSTNNSSRININSNSSGINSNSKNNNNTLIPESDSTNDSSPADNHHNHHHNQYQQQPQTNKYHSQPKQQQQNGNDLHGQETPRINHDHHNETSMDSSSNLSSDILLGTSTPIEKCSLNKRRGRNPDKEKRLQLTGYIIYASEIRKEVIDKNPNQNFGDISRLVGNEWKALPDEIREKYNDRAKKHNNIVKVGRLSIGALKRDAEDNSLYGLHQNGVSTPKLSSRELARRTKEQMRQFHLHAAHHDDSLNSSSRVNHDHLSSPVVSRVQHSTHKQQHSQVQPSAQISSKISTTESSTQTSAIRFVEPTTSRKRLAYSETFRKYIEGLKVPNRDLLIEETVPDRTVEVPEDWLGAGLGRHESPEAALWALRDFMLQDAVTMRRSLEPYL